jgi:hypothetical protein
MEVAAEYVGFTIMYPQDLEDEGDDEIRVSLESVFVQMSGRWYIPNAGCVPSIRANQCPRVVSAMNTRTKRLVFQIVHLERGVSEKSSRTWAGVTHVRMTRFVDVQATTMLPENWNR